MIRVEPADQRDLRDPVRTLIRDDPRRNPPISVIRVIRVRISDPRRSANPRPNF
jgi:hypothetical protein